MPRTTYPKDRFDDLPADIDRVGAHRAENPRMRGWVVFLWAALATVVLVIVGVFGSLVASGRIALAPSEAEATATPAPGIEPVLDTEYEVLVLNATEQTGLATTIAETVVAAGWSAEDVYASDASTTGFEETTVYYPYDGDEAAALGLADVVGAERVLQSDAYVQGGDAEDGTTVKELTIVIGTDRVAQG